MGKFGPRKQGAPRFVRDMVADIAAKRVWIAKALGISENDPHLDRHIEQIGKPSDPRSPRNVSFNQLGAQQQRIEAASYYAMREQQAQQARMGRIPQPVGVSGDASELEVEMTKTLNRGRSLLHSLIVSPGGRR